MEINYDIINAMICSIGITLGITGITTCGFVVYLDRSHRVYFTVMQAFLFIYGISAMISYFFNGVPGEMVHFALTLSNINEFLLPGVLLLMMSLYILRIMYSGDTLDRIRKVCLALLAVHTVLLIITQFNGMGYSVSQDNLFKRGDLYWLMYLPEFLGMLMMIILLLSEKRKPGLRKRFFFIALYIIPLFGSMLNIRNEGILFGTLSVEIDTMIFVFNIILTQARELRAREMENAKIRADMMLAQMQPHFIFNSLMSIEDLCYTEPEKAAEYIEDFSVYLRNNMDSLSAKEWIPFEKELSHIEQYIKLEKSDPSRKFYVEYDFEVTDFNIPTLTLQPIVENAVKHGALSRSDGEGKILIKTEKADDMILITVSDNGNGTVSQTDAQKEHWGIAMDNIKRRLTILCGGKMNMTSSSDGTLVTLTIPSGVQTGIIKSSDNESGI